MDRQPHLRAVPTGEDHYARIVYAARGAFGPDIEIPPNLYRARMWHILTASFSLLATAGFIVWIVVAWVTTP